MHILKLVLRPQPVVRVPNDYTNKIINSCLMSQRGLEAYIGCCCYSKHLLVCQKQELAKQAEEVQPKELALTPQGVICYLGTAPERGQTKCLGSCLWLGVDLGMFHHPLKDQSCYADSWSSSWVPPVRGARHGKDALFHALYTSHKVALNRMSCAGQGQNQISSCQTISP